MTKLRPEIEQALNELENAVQFGLTEAEKLAHKRLDALGVSRKERVAHLRKEAADAGKDVTDPDTNAPVQRSAAPAPVTVAKPTDTKG